MKENSTIDSCAITSILGSGPALYLSSGHAHLKYGAVRDCICPAGEAGAIHVASESILYLYAFLLANCSAPQVQVPKRRITCFGSDATLLAASLFLGHGAARFALIALHLTNRTSVAAAKRF
eukprot:6200425-Pleurochrysis_carterae.AAC.1